MRRYVVIGAGSVGGYAGGALAAAGLPVAFIARGTRREGFARGLRLTRFDGPPLNIAANAYAVPDAVGAALSTADIVIVAVKSRDTAAVAELIAQHAPKAAKVVSLQNGLAGIDTLREALPGRAVIAGMVPFNLRLTSIDAEGIQIHRASSGDILIDAGHDDVLSDFARSIVRVRGHPNMRGVQWAKLLMNLNNALNALSGLTLVDELSQRGWRRLLADQVSEALAVYAASGITPARIGRVSPGMIPRVLRLPDRIFHLVARQMLAIDPSARSSMWDDLQRGLPTEIDELQGAILALGRAALVATPVNAAVHRLVKAAEAAGAQRIPLTSDQVVSAIGPA